MAYKTYVITLNVIPQDTPKELPEETTATLKGGRGAVQKKLDATDKATISKIG